MFQGGAKWHRERVPAAMLTREYKVGVRQQHLEPEVLCMKGDSEGTPWLPEGDAAVGDSFRIQKVRHRKRVLPCSRTLLWAW